MKRTPRRDSTTSPAISFRLFEPGESDRPDEHDFGLSPAQRLSEFFAAFILPVALQGAATSHVKEMQTSLNYWMQFTGDPPLEAISVYTGADFKRGLSELKTRKGDALAQNTIRKHCVHIERMLKLAGPPDPKAPLAQDLLARIPYLQKPSLVVNEVSDDFSLEELAAFLSACKVAEWPHIDGIKPETWWRSLILFDLNVGLRLGTLRKLEYGWISGNILTVPNTAVKKKLRGSKHYLNAAALDALESIRTPRRLIYGCHGASDSWLQRWRRKILAASGLPPERHLGFHGIRKAHVTELGNINPLAAQMSAGHAAMETTRKHYAGRKVRNEAMDKIPQPKIIRDDPQQMLF